MEKIEFYERLKDITTEGLPIIIGFARLLWTMALAPIPI